MSPKRYLTPNEAARLLMVSPVTLRQWAQKGWLKSHATAGGHRRFLYHDLEYFAHERGLTLMHDDDNLTRILIVDDDLQLSGYLNELLSAYPQVDVETACDGFDAGGKIQTWRPHILLLDLMMPGLNGFDICQQLKSQSATRAIRIITMTGNHTPENVERALAAGAEACMAKPLDTPTLLFLLGLGDDTGTALTGVLSQP